VKVGDLVKSRSQVMGHPIGMIVEQFPRPSEIANGYDEFRIRWLHDKSESWIWRKELKVISESR
jgi:hypothetical protein